MLNEASNREPFFWAALVSGTHFASPRARPLVQLASGRRIHDVNSLPVSLCAVQPALTEIA